MIPPSASRVDPSAFPDAAHRPSSRDLPSLDGLRAISIGFVILGHACNGYVSPQVERVFAHLAHFGVCVFFVISGYLITSLLRRDLERRSEVKLGRFYFRRTMRIFPPYYAYLLIAWVVVVVGRWPVPSGTRWWPAVFYLSNFFDTNWNVTGHGWSLSLEEQFYLTWPILLAACVQGGGVERGSRRALITALATLAALPVARVVAFGITRSGVLTGALIFDYVAAGSAISLWMSSRHWHRGQAKMFALLASSAAPLTGLAALLLHVTFAGATRWRFAFDIAVVTSAEAILLAIFVAWSVRNPSHFVGRVLNLPVLRVIGIGSYSLYLWQQLVFFGPASVPRSVASLVTKMTVIGICAAGSYFLIERPSLRLRARIEDVVFAAKATE